MKNLFAWLVAILFYTTCFAQNDSLGVQPPVLPLKVASFETQAINKNIQLKWSVSGNEDARSFEVERADDNVVYKTIGGKLSLAKTGYCSYMFVDALPAKNLLLSYRIKVIAKDGAVSYSVTQPAMVEESNWPCRLKQNPVGQTIDFEITATENASLQAFVFTGTGQKVLTQTRRLSVGVNQISISSQNLLQGLHRLVVQVGVERKVFSFIKE